MQDNELAYGSVLADDGVETNGALEEFLTGNMRVFRLNSFYKSRGGYVAALANTRAWSIGSGRVLLSVRITHGPRTIGKVIWDFGSQDETKATIDIDERKKAKEMVAILKAELVEGNGPKAKLKCAEGRFTGVVVTRFREACGGYFIEVTLKSPEKKAEDLRRDMVSISSVFCAFVVGDAGAKSIQVPGRGIRKNHGLYQCSCAGVVAALLRLEYFLCEVFEAAGGIWEIELQRSGRSRGSLSGGRGLGTQRRSAKVKKREGENQS